MEQAERSRPRRQDRPARQRRRLASHALAAWTLLLAAVPPAAAADLLEPSPEPQLYLAELVHEGRALARDLPLYESSGRHYLGFDPFLRAVEFAIERDGEHWAGWWISPDSHFRWKPSESDAELSLDTPDGLAVALEQLERWFALRLDFDPRRQRLRLGSERPLPLEQREARASRRARGLGAGETEPAVVWPDRYGLLGLPVLDVSLHARFDGGDGREIGDSQSLSVDLGTDLLGHSVVYDGVLTRSDDRGSQTQHRLTFAREAATVDGTLFAGLTGYSFGDVFSTSRNLVEAGGAGMGLILERRRRPGRDAGLSTTLVQGDAPPGWDVELHRNGRLVAFGVVGPDGRWSFDELETVRGENRFVARLYGPQGQYEEQERLVWGGGAELPRGEGEFRFAHVDHSRRLLEGELEDESFLPTGRSTDLRGSLAVTDSLQLGLAFTRAEVTERDDSKRLDSHDYASLFGRWGLGRGVLVGELVDQLDAGEAWRLEYLGTWRGHDYRISHESRDDFESPRTRREAPLRSRTRVSLSGALPFGGFEHYLLRASVESRLEGADEWRLFARVAGRFGPVALTNDLEWSHYSEGGGDRVDGRLRAAGRVKNVHLSASLDYELTGDDPFRQLSATLRWRPGPRVYSAFTLRGNLAGGDELWLEGLLTARRRGLDYTLRGAVSSDGDWSVSAQLLLHLGRSVPGGSWLADTSSAARSGRIVLAPFLDRDGDGRRGPGEPAVVDATWQGEGATGSDPGLLAAGFAPGGQPVDLDLRHLRLPDPFLVPAAQRYQVLTHAGGLVRVDVPVLETVDLGGWLSALGEEPLDPASLAVSVLSGGRTLETVRPEIDGYFLLERLPVGEHELVVRELGEGRELARRPLRLSADDGFVLVDPIAVARRPAPPEPADARLRLAGLDDGSGGTVPTPNHGAPPASSRPGAGL